MKRINKDRYMKTYTQEYSRTFSKSRLEKKREELIKKLAEIDDLLAEVEKTKDKGV